jgi:hypothetical protein
MGKVRDPSIHLQLGHLINRYPHASVDKIYKITRREKIIGSINTLWYTLEYMEKNRIILNAECLIKNFRNYKNMHYILKTENWGEFFDKFISQFRNQIEVILYMDAYDETRIYLKAHNELPIPGDCKILESHIWTNFVPIHPHSISVKDLETRLKTEPEPGSERVLCDFTVDEDLTWNDEMWDTFHWIRVNYRMGHSDLARLIGKAPQTAYRRRMFIDQFICMDYPIFIGGSDSYEMLFFSFETKYPGFFIDILSKNTAISYLIQTEAGRTICFINTTIPKTVNNAMRGYEDTGIIHDLKRIQMTNRWDPILEDYTKGVIPERYFWMFKIGVKKRKRL